MITIQEYNEAEAEAIQLSPQLHRDNQWGMIPVSDPHLVTVGWLGGLQVLLNRFQCDRYRTYMYELGGLAQVELDFFLHLRNRLISMQRRHYPELEPIVPVETMLSAMTISHKVMSARPGVETILEVGPGAGLNALFFSTNLVVRNYTQIEATQATYLSQAMVNDVCYGDSEWDVWEAARPELAWPTHSARLWHVPWWRVDELYDKSVSYDVIMANACLNEISNEMLERYLLLFGEKAHQDTLLLVQDTGAWMYRDEAGLRERLHAAGWFLMDVTTNYDIERAVGDHASSLSPPGHGDAVTTWWLTRHVGARVTRPARRCERGLVTLDAGTGKFRLPGSDREWGREELARGELSL